jgi:hypothetical protein
MILHCILAGWSRYVCHQLKLGMGCRLVMLSGLIASLKGFAKHGQGSYS